MKGLDDGEQHNNEVSTLVTKVLPRLLASGADRPSHPALVQCLADLNKAMTEASKDRVALRLNSVQTLTNLFALPSPSAIHPDRLLKVAAAVLPACVRAVFDHGSESAVHAAICSDALGLIERISARAPDAVRGQSSALVGALVGALGRGRAAPRRRAAVCLAAVALRLPEQESGDLLLQIVEAVEAPSLGSPAVAPIAHALSLLLPVVGAKAAALAPRAAAAAVLHARAATQLGQDDDFSAASECLTLLAASLRAVPASEADSASPPWLGDALDAAVLAASFDPLYGPGDDDDAPPPPLGEGPDCEEEQNGGRGGWDDDGGYSEDGGWSDDGAVPDDSWRVRRAACHVCQAAARAHPEALPMVLERAGPVLARRAAEREEAVRRAALAALTTALREARSGAREGVVASSGDGAIASPLDTALASVVVPLVARVAPLAEPSQSDQTRADAWTCLSAAAHARPDAFPAPALAKLGRRLVAALQDPDPARESIQIAALGFLRAVAASAGSHTGAGAGAGTPPPGSAVAVAAALPAVVSAATAGRSRAAAVGALGTASAVVACAKQAPESAARSALGAVLARCVSLGSEGGLDPEVRRSAVDALAALLTIPGAGPLLHPATVSEALGALASRLGEESTRLTACRAVASIVRGAVAAGLSPAALTRVRDRALEEVPALLRQTDRQVLLAALDVALALAESAHGEYPAVSPTNALAVAAAPLLSGLQLLVSDSDLQVAAGALDLAAALVDGEPAAAAGAWSSLKPRVLALVASPLVEGSVVGSVAGLVASMVRAGAVTASDVIGDLLKAAREGPFAVAGATVGAHGPSAAARDACARASAAALAAAGPDRALAAALDLCKPPSPAEANVKVIAASPNAALLARLAVAGEAGAALTACAPQAEAFLRKARGEGTFGGREKGGPSLPRSHTPRFFTTTDRDLPFSPLPPRSLPPVPQPGTATAPASLKTPLSVRRPRAPSACYCLLSSERGCRSSWPISRASPAGTRGSASSSLRRQLRRSGHCAAGAPMQRGHGAATSRTLPPSSLSPMPLPSLPRPTRPRSAPRWQRGSLMR